MRAEDLRVLESAAALFTLSVQLPMERASDFISGNAELWSPLQNMSWRLECLGIVSLSMGRPEKY